MLLDYRHSSVKQRTPLFLISDYGSFSHFEFGWISDIHFKPGLTDFYTQAGRTSRTIWHYKVRLSGMAGFAAESDSAAGRLQN